MGSHLFTSESVTEGHPDKVADQISDAVLDHMLADDPASRVACETLVTTGLALVAGEITTETYVEIPEVVRETLRGIGYTNSAYGIDAQTCAVLSSIDKQSGDIAQGVDTGGAGDQGMMFGYAADETPELMPAAVLMAHRITQRLAALRHEGELEWLRPDGIGSGRYDQGRLVVKMGYFGLGGLWFDVENAIGLRNYLAVGDPTGILLGEGSLSPASDFIYNELTVLFGFQAGILTADLYGQYTVESHAVGDDDVTFFLMNARTGVRF